ncbi:MAG: porin [Bacteroidaceae bacterium]|nr:porin [Bacteroidaceae bacterium]
MKNKILLLSLSLLLFCGTTKANDVETTPIEKKIEFGISTTTYPDANVAKSLGTRAETNSLNLDIGLSRLRLFGYGQMWFNYKHANKENSNSAEVKRIILMADAQITDKLSFFLMYDAAVSELHEYYAQYAFKPWLQLRVGQFKQPFTLESLYSPTFMSTIFYDPSVLYLAGIATDPLMGNNVARDMGIMFTGDFCKNKNGRYLMNYSIGVFNGPGMNIKENNSQKDVIGMLKYMPTKNLLVEGSFLVGTGHAQASSVYGATKLGDDYSRHRWNVGVEATFAPFYLRGEYIQGYDGGIHSRGGYINFIYTPIKKFDIVLNWDYLDKNTHCHKKAQKDFAINGWVTELQTYTAGAQYWIYKRCRLSAQFVYTRPRVGEITREFISQLQISF